MPPAPRLLNPARLPGEGPSETPQRDLREGDVPFSPHSWPGPHTLGSARGRGAASERRLAVGSGVGFGICACAWVREPPGTTERGKGRPGAGAVAEDGRRGRTGRGCARGPPLAARTASPRVRLGPTPVGKGQREARFAPRTPPPLPHSFRCSPHHTPTLPETATPPCAERKGTFVSFSRRKTGGIPPCQRPHRPEGSCPSEKVSALHPPSSRLTSLQCRCAVSVLKSILTLKNKSEQRPGKNVPEGKPGARGRQLCRRWCKQGQ